MTTWAVLPHSESPLYVRLKEALREAVTSGMAPGDAFPSESQIEDYYRISRTTVRQALSALADEGVIVRRQGRGNVVADPKRLIREFGLLSASSPTPVNEQESIRVINAEVVELDAQRAALLEVETHTAALRLRQVHSIEGRPVSYQVNYLCVADLSEPLDTKKWQSPDHLDSLARRSATARNATVDIVLADAFRAQHLDVPVGSPLLLVERVGLDESGRPVELSRSFHPGRSIRLSLFSDLPIGETAAASLATTRK